MVTLPLAIAAAIAGVPVSAWAEVPAPANPSTSPAANDAISWFEGVFEDASEVGILILGVLLFIMGAAGMVWAILQVMSGRATIGEVGKIGLASATGIAFGTYALTQATAII
jgi:hypothetical protein